MSRLASVAFPFRLSLVLCGLSFLALAGCAFFRGNPLDEHRGAVVLVFDTRTAGDLETLRQALERYDARATVFAAGQVDRGLALNLHDLCDAGCEIGLSGLKGVDPQLYSRMYGQQKYFQDEIVTQVLNARRYGHNPRYFLLAALEHANSETLTLPSFLVSKGFRRVIHKMPVLMAPRAKSVSELTGPVLHAYCLSSNNLDRTQIANLAKRDEILVVAPSLAVLPDLLEAVREQDVPFATVGDLKLER